jgi:hypothetical protein
MTPKDKLLRIALGGVTIACALLVLSIYEHFGLGASLAATTTLVGALYEVNQRVRKEGQPDPWDAAVTAAPGFVAWAVLEMLK